MQLASALENAETCGPGIEIGKRSWPRRCVARKDDCLSQSDIDVPVAIVSSLADTNVGFYSFEAASSIAQGCFALCVLPSVRGLTLSSGLNECSEISRLLCSR